MSSNRETLVCNLMKRDTDVYMGKGSIRDVVSWREKVEQEIVKLYTK